MEYKVIDFKTGDYFLDNNGDLLRITNVNRSHLGEPSVTVKNITTNKTVSYFIREFKYLLKTTNYKYLGNCGIKEEVAQILYSNKV